MSTRETLRQALRDRRQGMRRSIAGLAILTVPALLAVPMVVTAADESPDQSFYEDAWQGNLAEVQQGQLAESKGRSQAVKDFGTMMVKEHVAANEQVRTLATKKASSCRVRPVSNRKLTRQSSKCCRAACSTHPI